MLSRRTVIWLASETADVQRYSWPWSLVITGHRWSLLRHDWLTWSLACTAMQCFELFAEYHSITITTICSPSYGHSTRSSHYVTMIKPSSSLKVAHRSFQYASPHLSSQHPTALRIPHLKYSSLLINLHLNMLAWQCYTALSPCITSSLFHHTFPIQKIFSSTRSAIVCFCLSD